MKKIIVIIVCIGICFLVAFLSTLLQQDALENWYPSLIKAPLNPSPSIFPIAWTILYILMGLSIALIICKNNVLIKFKIFPVLLFIVQLLLNYIWSYTFFYSKELLLGAINIIFLIVVCCLYIHYARKVDSFAAWLFIPYILWLLFALYLNLYIYWHN